MIVVPGEGEGGTEAPISLGGQSNAIEMSEGEEGHIFYSGQMILT